MKKIFFAITMLTVAFANFSQAQSDYQVQGSYNVPPPEYSFDNERDNQYAVALQPGEVILVRVYKTRELPNNNGDELHRIANEFANEVGNKLKSNYPAEIHSLAYIVESAGNNIRLTYEALIKRSDETSYQRFFDHRGALSSDVKRQDAVDDASSRMTYQVNQSLPKIKTATRNGYLFTHSGRTEVAEHRGQWIALSETFFAW
jgi:hypothetical protein